MRFTLCLALSLAACSSEGPNPPLRVDAAVVALDALSDVAPAVDAPARDAFDVTGPQPCTPGQVAQCICGVNRFGTQACLASGAFGPCVCGDAGLAPPDVVVPREDVRPADVGCLDFDLDGYGPGCELGPDCNDGDRTIHPGAMEICDGIDQNCDGNADALAVDAGVAPYDPAVNAYCEGLLQPDAGAWDRTTPRCVTPSMPPAFQVCVSSAREPRCVACQRVGGATECQLRGPTIVSGGCVPR